MMSSASPHTRMMIFTVLAGLAVLAALWVLAISPKRSESAAVSYTHLTLPTIYSV